MSSIKWTKFSTYRCTILNNGDSKINRLIYGSRLIPHSCCCVGGWAAGWHWPSGSILSSGICLAPDESIRNRSNGPVLSATHTHRIRVDFFHHSTRLRCVYLLCIYVCCVCVSHNLQTGRCVPVGGFQEAAQRWLPVRTLAEAETELGVAKATWEHGRVTVWLSLEDSAFLPVTSIKYIFKVFIFLFYSILAGHDRWNTTATFIFALVWSTLIQKSPKFFATNQRCLGSSQTHSFNYEICFLKMANCLLISEHKRKWPSTSILWNLWVKYEAKNRSVHEQPNQKGAGTYSKVSKTWNIMTVQTPSDKQQFCSKRHFYWCITFLGSWSVQAVFSHQNKGPVTSASPHTQQQKLNFTTG